ncbi:MAG: GGDEF domain-containing protein [Chloroflexales bacterium]|jgi:diguanylate cyclase (GGDEF)-like protein
MVNIDLYTLAIVQSLMSIVQMVVLFIQYRLTKTYAGLGWWAAGSAALSLGFGVAILWKIPIIGQIAMIASVAMVASGMALLYVGVLRFFGQREPRERLIVFCVLITFIAIYFTVIDDRIEIRRLIVSVVVAAMSLLLARSLFIYRIRSLSVPIYFLIVMSLSNAIFYGIRTLETLRFGVSVDGAFRSTPTETALYLIALIITTLWTFGLIILVNQRLSTELEKRATTDELTGITNRRHFLELAQNEIQRTLRLNRPLALTLIDIDHFKHINDTYGHAVGDQALLAWTHLCQNNIRQIDVFARLGGDEFVLLFPETTCDHAYEVMNRICLALGSQPFTLSDRSVSMTISSGVAGLISADDTIDTLLERTDRALYRAKEAGRNRVVAEHAVSTE